MDIKLEQKPREVAYRRWIGLARVLLYAPIPLALCAMVIALCGWLPTWFDPDFLIYGGMALIVASIGTSTMASWRFDTMICEWSQRKLRRWGWKK